MFQLGDPRALLREGRWLSQRRTTPQPFSGRRAHADCFQPHLRYEGRPTTVVLRRRQMRSPFAMTKASSEDSPVPKNDSNAPDTVTSIAHATSDAAENHDVIGEQSDRTEVCDKSVT